MTKMRRLPPGYVVTLDGRAVRSDNLTDPAATPFVHHNPVGGCDKGLGDGRAATNPNHAAGSPPFIPFVDVQLGEVVIELTIPGRAIPKERPRFGQGQAYTPPATRMFEAEVRRYGRYAMGDREPVSGPLLLHVVFWMDRGAKTPPGLIHPIAPGYADTSNLLKAIEDGLQSRPGDPGVFTDDKLIVGINAWKAFTDLEPGTYIRLEALPQG
jgi:Holliday junction resolvase RusA-like endonuclease